MSGHAELAPSASERWTRCPGSVGLCRGIPDEGSPAAREGTFAHAVAERCLKSGLQAEAMLDSTDGEFTCDGDMVGHVQTYIDAVLDVEPARGCEPAFEVKVTLTGVRNDIHGTLDAMVLAPGNVLHVFDLKYGSGVFVDVEDNPQLKIYALGVLLTFGSLMSKVEEVVLHVVQPRHHRGGHSLWTVGAVELRAWGSVVLKEAARLTDDPAAALHAGEWCGFCRAKPICPELRRASLEHAGQLFTDETMEAPAKVPPKPESLGPEELATALAAFPVIEQWIRAVREHAYGLAAGGSAPPGFKLVAKVGNRRWKDEADAAAALEMFLPDGKEPWQERRLLSPAQAEKLLGKGDKKVVAGLTTKPHTGSVLVPVADKRPALVRADVFDDGAALTNTDQP